LGGGGGVEAKKRQSGQNSDYFEYKIYLCIPIYATERSRRSKISYTQRRKPEISRKEVQ
jgi:hypothetical protein